MILTKLPIFYNVLLYVLTAVMSRDGNRIDDLLRYLLRKKIAMRFFDALRIRIRDAILRCNADQNNRCNFFAII